MVDVKVYKPLPYLLVFIQSSPDLPGPDLPCSSIYRAW